MTNAIPVSILDLGPSGIAPFGPPGASPSRRTPESAITEFLLLFGFAHEVAAGQELDCAAKVRQALDRWCASGLPHTLREDGCRLFDPVEVANFVTWAGLLTGDEFWERQCVPTARRHLRDFTGATDDAAPDGLFGPRDFRLRVTRRFGTPGAPAGQRTRLLMRHAIEADGQHYLAPAVVTAPENARVRTSANRVEATLTMPATPVEISVDYHLGFDPPQFEAEAPLSADERDLYLHPNEGLVQITPSIAGLAELLAGTGTDPLAVAARFRDFIHSRLIFGVLRYDLIPHEAPLDWLLRHRWFDCHLGSAMMIALCRARGIPARLCAGYLLHRLVPAFHYWAEIWCPATGWRGYDIANWGLSAAGRDAAWRDVWSGSLEPRMQTERLPRQFTGMGNLHLPARWHMLHRRHGDGLEVMLCERETGALVVSDRVAFIDAAQGR